MIQNYRCLTGSMRSDKVLVAIAEKELVSWGYNTKV